jgi:hypothetical protein
MERALSVWMEKNITKGLPIASTILKVKAKFLYNHHQEEQGGEGSSPELLQKPSLLVKVGLKDLK